jgi:two-component system, chemotaxis family, protein-glutamate methylesterase/glutaminase
VTTRSLPGTVKAVVVGTSAGGVEALSALVPALPAGLTVPVLVVLHLPPTRPSLIVELLSPRSAVPVCEAEDKAPVEPGTVYLAPPDYHLLVDAGPRIALSSDDPVLFSRPSIDVLFESAADMYGAGLVGIMLTGGSRDGALGLDAVRRAGGVTIVQSPADARVPLMVEAALELGPVDFVEPLSGIAVLLRTLPHA